MKSTDLYKITQDIRLHIHHKAQENANQQTQTKKSTYNASNTLLERLNLTNSCKRLFEAEYPV